MLQLSDIKLKMLKKSATKKFIYFLCECFLNVINGNVPIKEILTGKFEGKKVI